MFYLSSSNTELCRRFLYLFVSGVIIAWQANPELKTINFIERRFPDLLYYNQILNQFLTENYSERVTQLSIHPVRFKVPPS